MPPRTNGMAAKALAADQSTLDGGITTSSIMTTRAEPTCAAAPPKPNRKQKPRSIPVPDEGSWYTRAKTGPEPTNTDTDPTKTSDSTAKPTTKPVKAAAKKPAASETPNAKAKITSTVSANGAVKKRGRPKKEKAPGMYSVISNHAPTMNSFASLSRGWSGGNSVLVRPTERTKNIKKRILKEKAARALLEKKKLQMGVKIQEKEEAVVEVKKDKTSKETTSGKDGKGLLGLEKHIRARIWRYAVVYPSHFVWPDSVSGKEQPDLAMVCREIREEVLPIYYAENIFAVDVSPTSLSVAQQDVATFFGGTKKTKAAAKTAQDHPKADIKASKIATWAAVLEERGWFSMIRHWCFTYAPDSSIRKDSEDNSLVVSVNFFTREDRSWHTHGPEVHRDAFCVLGFRKCKIQLSPDWVNEAVYQMLDATKGKPIGGEMLVGLVEKVRERVDELVDLRCEDPLMCQRGFVGRVEFA
ncbi:hypothetical protein LTR37_012258 [Vermiconidia calcicola]|uniref:Uncharacterized protein n=1 Tax=Vermiconidia calcicola TaxID=1690605 RepID=A0ACC3N081_9PEZI|nr:hypothetical protein LTR37_012258 [Vermiconidia calcicola]